MIKKWVQRFYLFLIILFLYAPIGTLIVLSFNNSRTSVKWEAFPSNGISSFLKVKLS